MKNILALDQASRITGWSVFKNGGLVEYGHFSVDDEDIGIRFNKIRDKVSQLIMDYDIDCVIFEDIQHQGNVANNVQTFKILAEVFGVIYELVTSLGIEHYTVLAATWKSILGIKGRARTEQKKNAQDYVIKTYNVKPTQDESDAICIGTYLLTSVGEIGKAPAAEERVDWE